MLEQDSERKAGPNLAAPSAPGMNFPPTSDPQEGARLIRAFLRIGDPGVRLAIIQMVEKMSLANSAPADC